MPIKHSNRRGCVVEKGVTMSRFFVVTVCLCTLSGCSILERVDMTIQRLDTANSLLAKTNGKWPRRADRWLRRRLQWPSRIGSSSNLTAW